MKSRRQRWSAIVISVALVTFASVMALGRSRAVYHERVPDSIPPGMLWAGAGTSERSGIPLPLIAAWAERGFGIHSAAGMVDVSLTLAAREQTEAVRAAAVTERFFETLNWRVLLGRPLSREDFAAGASPVVVLSYGYWIGRFSGSSAAIGATLTLNGTAFTVVGVASQNQRYPRYAELGWIPAPAVLSQLADSDVPVAEAIVRPSAGAPVRETRRALRNVANELIAAGRIPHGTDVVTKPLNERMLGDARGLLASFQLAVVLVGVLTACNCCLITLLDAVDQERYVAVRFALGATRRAIVCGELAGVVGGMLAGLLLGGALVLSLATNAGEGRHTIFGVAVELRVIDGAFILAGIAMTIVSCAALLAARLARLSWWSVLREGGSTASSGRTRLRATIVAAEVALALPLSIGASLLVTAAIVLSLVRHGFDPRDVDTVAITPPAVVVTPTEAAQLRLDGGRLLALADVDPGVEAAALSSDIPSLGAAFSAELQTTDGRTFPAGVHAVSARYFEALRIPVLSGAVPANEIATDAPVKIAIDANTANRAFAGRPAVGQRVSLKGLGVEAEVTAVVGNVRDIGYRWDSPPSVFINIWQLPVPRMVLLLRRKPGTRSSEVVGRVMDGRPTSLAASAPRSLGGLLASYWIKPLQQLLSVGVFALVSLALVVIALASITRLTVLQRGHELQIRAALGATPSDLRRSLSRDLGMLVVPGLAAGLLISWPFVLVVQGSVTRVPGAVAAAYVGGVLAVVGGVVLSSFAAISRAGTVAEARGLPR